MRDWIREFGSVVSDEGEAELIREALEAAELARLARDAEESFSRWRRSEDDLDKAITSGLERSGSLEAFRAALLEGRRSVVIPFVSPALEAELWLD